MKAFGTETKQIAEQLGLNFNNYLFDSQVELVNEFFACLASMDSEHGATWNLSKARSVFRRIHELEHETFQAIADFFMYRMNVTVEINYQLGFMRFRKISDEQPLVRIAIANCGASGEVGVSLQ